MPRSISATKRIVKTLQGIEQISSGVTGVRRSSIPITKVSLSIPNRVNFCVIKNVGSNVVRLNFNNDSANDYWTLVANAQTPVIGLGRNIVVNAISITAASTIEVIYW